ncbi:LamG domain-containing protein [Nostoc sp. ChiQUE01b]|uniref:LamG domain-containing protein n=1 Tax=Nostoc sp. ChiQUE01b TaxID=3075376 RepID=UPI002AD2299F|nr:LamG domain-containing protein [Nostoc sp. ChiQUE01b]MDZ8262858.1 LamG domain-containing protein [Nostoc sp. ChiQUE01b]
MLSLEKLRIAVAGVSITYPLQSVIPPAKRTTQQAMPSQETMQQTPPSDSFPNAPTFDGVDDKLDMPYAPELNPGSFTVEMWVMVQGGSGYQSILASVGGSPLAGRKGYLFCITPARQWQFWLGNGEPKAFWRVLSGTQAKIGAWTHLAGTYDRNSQTMAFLINGREVGREMGVQYQPNDRNPTRVGAGATEQWGASPCFFRGKIAEVHVWDRVLASKEIQALAAQQSIEVQAEPIQENGGQWGQEGQSVDQTKQTTGNFSGQKGQTTTANFSTQKGQNTNPSPPLQPSVEKPLTQLPVKETPLTSQQPGPTTAAIPDPQTVLWQIGFPGQAGTPAPTGGWTIEYNYIVGTDPDPLNRPTIPSCLVPFNANKIPNSTSQLNIHFGLLEDYTDEQLVFSYDRYGSGEDNIFLDGQLIAKTPGADKGKLKQSQIPLGSIRQGPHTISITTANGADAAHLIDYLQLQIHKPMLSNLTSQLGGLTGASSTSKGNQSNPQQSSAQLAQGGGLLGGVLDPVTSVAGQVAGGGGNEGLVGQATGLVGGVAGQLPVAGELVGGLTNQNSGGEGVLGGLLNQVGGLAGGLPVAGGLVGGLTGQGGGGGGLADGLVNQVGGLAGGLPVVGGLVGGVTGQGGGDGLAGGLLNQVGGLAGGLPGVGGVVGGLTGQVAGLAGGLPGVGGVVGGLTGQGGAAQGGHAGASAEVVVQLAGLVQQLTVLVTQLTQLISQLGIANQAHGGVGGATQTPVAGQLAGGGVSLPGLTPAQVTQLSTMTGLSAPQLAQLSALTNLPPAQLLQLPAMTGLSPAQVLAQLQAQQRR